MLLRVTVLVFLFLARIRFPRTKSIATIIQSTYDNKTLKMVRKLKELDFKLRKAKLDIKFYVSVRIMILYLIFRVLEQLIKT